jgi:hypothetical protein
MKGNPRGSGYEKAEDNWYQETREAVDLLLDHEPFGGPVWDPACGEGNIPKACRARNIAALGSDLVDRGFGKTNLNFLTITGVFRGDVVTNPPFDVIESFIHHALKISTGKVAIVGRLALLEGRRRRETLFTVTPFARVWVFSRRMSMPPGGRGIVAKGGSVPFAWFVWDRAHPIGEPARVGFLP